MENPTTNHSKITWQNISHVYFLGRIMLIISYSIQWKYQKRRQQIIGKQGRQENKWTFYHIKHNWIHSVSLTTNENWIDNRKLQFQWQFQIKMCQFDSITHQILNNNNNNHNDRYEFHSDQKFETKIIERKKDQDFSPTFQHPHRYIYILCCSGKTPIENKTKYCCCCGWY